MVLNVGCGNSEFSEKMYDDGYKNNYNIDFCKNVIKDKERDEVRTCTLSAALNNPSLIILGAKGCCPYHEYPEYYGVK